MCYLLEYMRYYMYLIVCRKVLDFFYFFYYQGEFGEYDSWVLIIIILRRGVNIVVFVILFGCVVVIESVVVLFIDKFIVMRGFGRDFIFFNCCFVL